MEQILNKHPDLKDVLTRLPQLRTYKLTTENNKLIEQWEKNEEGRWIDVTEREKLKERIAAEQQEIERLRKLECKRAKEKQDEQSVEERND